LTNLGIIKILDYVMAVCSALSC